MARTPISGPHGDVQLQSGEIAARIQATRSGLVPSAVKVIDLIVSAPSAVLMSSVSEVADRAGTSESTVIRACQALGFKGFHDLKLTLASDLTSQRLDSDDLQRAEGIGPRTPRNEIPRLVLRSTVRALLDAERTLDLDAFTTAVDILADASRILVIGNGTSSAPAQDAGYRLSTLGLIVHAPTDAFGQDLAARALNERDAMLAVSHTGATKETLHVATSAHRTGAQLIAVTSHLKSPLTAQAHVALVAGGPELGFRQEAMTSRAAHLAILDALFVGLALARPKRSRDYLDLMATVTADHSL